MNLNNTVSLPIDKVINCAELMSMESILRRVRQSGEIHIETTGRGLTLKLFCPHNAIDGYSLDADALDRRGISVSPEFEDIERIAVTERQIVLFPVKVEGRQARKRTLKFRKGWVWTKRTFFSDFTITDTPL